MTIHAKKTSLIRAILMVFTAFLLTSCRLEGTIDYRPDAKTVLSFEVEDSTGSMTKIKQTCESVKIMAQANASFIKNPKVEDLTSPGGNTKCKVTSNEPLGGAPGLREDSKSYRVEVPASRKKTDYSGFIVKMTIIMPGRVTKANIGKIDGNKVMIDDPNFWSKGISITAEKEGASKASTSDGGPSRPSNEKTGAESSRGDSASSFPVWGWGLAGGGVLAVIAGAWLILGRRQRAAHAPTTGPSQAPVVPSTLAQQARPYTPGQQATNPPPYPHNNAQAAPPSGYGYNATPTSPQTPSPDHTQDDPDARYRPR